MKKANIGINEESKQAVADQFSKILADEFVLYTKLLNAHWNVEGNDFHATHIFLETLYKKQQSIVDDVAEKIRALGHYAPGQLEKILKLTNLLDKAPDSNDTKTLYADLLEAYESIIIFLRENIITFEEKYKAAGATDFITALMEEHMKTAWMIRAHLK